MKLRISLVILSLVLSVLIGFQISQSKHGSSLAAGDATSASGKPGESSAPVSAGKETALVPTKATGTTKKIRIGLSLDTLKEERWQRDRDTFIARVEALGGEVVVLSANSDDVQQLKDCDSLLGRGISVLVIAPHNSVVIARAVERAHEEKVPVCAYDRIIADCDLDYYFTFDNVGVGELQGSYLMKLLFPEGAKAGAVKKRIARIYGAPTDNNAKQFKQGQDKAIQPFLDAGLLEVVFADWAEDWKPENAKKITQAAISKAGATTLDGFLVSNDGTAGGCIQALREEQLAGKIPVTGQDADLDACRRVLAGEQAMTVYKPLKRFAEFAAEGSVALARGEKVKTNGTTNNGKIEVPSVQSDIFAVDQKNMRETVVKDGFHPEAALYGTK